MLRCACIENLNAAKTHCNFIKEMSKSLKQEIFEAREQAILTAENHHAFETEISEVLKRKVLLWNFLAA